MGARAAGCWGCPAAQGCLSAPARRAPRRWQEPALCPLDQIRKRNYLCLLHISGPDCQKWQAALGHSDSAVAGGAAPAGDRQTGTRQPFPPLSPCSWWEGAGTGKGLGGAERLWGTSCSEITEGFSADSLFSLKYLKKKNHLFLALCNG